MKIAPLIGGFILTKEIVKEGNDTYHGNYGHVK